MPKIYDPRPPIVHHFIVRSDAEANSRYELEAKAQYLERQLQTILHDKSIRVDVSIEEPA